MRKRITIDVSDTDRQALTAIVTGRNSPQKHVWRAQIVLLTADGCGTMELTRRTGTSKTSVWLLVQPRPVTRLRPRKDR